MRTDALGAVKGCRAGMFDRGTLFPNTGIYRIRTRIRDLRGRHVPSRRSQGVSSGRVGFVCSSAEAQALLKRKWALEHANNAHTWNFDRESRGPALPFASA